MLKKILFLFIYTSLLFNLLGNTIKEFFPVGYIDWTKGEININAKSNLITDSKTLITSRNYQLVLEDALFDLFKKTQQIFRGFRINNEDLADQIFRDSESLFLELEKIVYSTDIKNLYFLADGNVSLEISIPLYGTYSIGSLLIPSVLGKYLLKENKNTIATPQPKLDASIENVYTGLIIDASLIDLKPSLIPKIINQKNQEVLYGKNKNIDLNLAIANGFAIYTSSLKNAKSMQSRIGKNPLIIRAVASSGPFQTDLTIFNSDFEKIVKAIRNFDFLQRAKVVIVLRS